MSASLTESLRLSNRFPVTLWKSHWFEEVNLMYVWTIHNFNNIFSTNLYCPFFAADGYDDTFWRVDLKETGDWLGVGIQLGHSSVPALNVKCRFSLINNKGEEVNVMEKTSPEHVCLHFTTGFQKFIEKKTLADQASTLLPDEKLTIFCKFMFVVSKAPMVDPFEQFEKPESELCRNFKNLLGNDKFSDVTFVVAGHEFPAHKAVLSARSPVFATMFHADTIERKLRRVTITDICPKVFKELLHFIYTGKIPNLGKMAKALLYAAERYALEELKLVCSKIPIGKLSGEQAADLLFLLDDYDVVDLKAQALSLIKSMSNYTIITKGGKSYVTSCIHFDAGACSMPSRAMYD